jgi:hypothetical protein
MGEPDQGPGRRHPRRLRAGASPQPELEAHLGRAGRWQPRPTQAREEAKPPYYLEDTLLVFDGDKQESGA